MSPLLLRSKKEADHVYNKSPIANNIILYVKRFSNKE